MHRPESETIEFAMLCGLIGIPMAYAAFSGVWALARLVFSG
jgi:hypothetical protein